MQLLFPGIFNTVDNGGGGGAVPTWGALGTPQGSGGTQTVPWPTHSAGHIGYLTIEQRGNDTTPATPSGWTSLGTFATGSGSSDTKFTVFERVATSSSEADVSLADNGNHQNSAIFTIVGATGATQLGTTSTGTGTTVTITSGTTGGSNRLLVFIVCNPTDTATDQISSWTATGLTSVVDRGGAQSAAVAGGGWDVGVGEKITAGAVGNITATLATSAKWAACVLEVS